MSRRLPAVGLALVLACSGPASEPAGSTVASVPEAEVTEQDSDEQRIPTTTTPPETVTSTAPESGSEGVEPSGGHELTCWVSPLSSQGEGGIVFEDVTAASGLVDPLTGMHGHAVIWGDVDGDDIPDLFVGTFADRPPERYRHRGADGPTPDRLLLSDGSAFRQDPGFPEMLTRTSGGVAFDLDADGDHDLVLSRNYRDRIDGAPSTQILRNDGDGIFTPLEGVGLPNGIGGRSVAVLDYDLDGLPDLFITEDRWSGGSSVLLRNLGGLRFDDVTSQAGIPTDVHGLGVAAADLNGDRLTDLFVAGSNRVFLATDEGRFEEFTNAVFDWEVYGDEDDVSGVSVADINRDGMMDLAIGHHYNSTLDRGVQVPIRLYLNRGNDSQGIPRFEDVTNASGLVPLPTKAPHVEINDLDNDGLADLITSASAADGAGPAIFRNQGLENGVPSFGTPEGLGSPQYWVAAPTADYDRDGRLDMFLLEWEPALPSRLLENGSNGGHWLQVSVDATAGHGLGWRVEVYSGTNTTSPTDLLGVREITVTQGYSAGVSPVAHFGLGDTEAVTVRLIPPGDSQPVTLTDIGVDRHIRYPSGCTAE